MILVRLYALLEIELFVSQTPQRQQEISDHLQKLLMEVTLLLRIFLIEIKIMLTENTDSYVGWPGCTHDARVFKNSNIYEELENGILNPNFHSPVHTS